MLDEEINSLFQTYSIFQRIIEIKKSIFPTAFMILVPND